VRIRLDVLALCGTCRVGNLNVIIATFGLPDGILPLLIDKGRELSICLLGTFEQFIACEAQQNVCIDRIRTHESPVVGEWLGGLVQLGSAEDGVRVRTAGSAREAQEI